MSEVTRQEIDNINNAIGRLNALVAMTLTHPPTITQRDLPLTPGFTLTLPGNQIFKACLVQSMSTGIVSSVNFEFFKMTFDQGSGMSKLLYVGPASSPDTRIIITTQQVG